MDGLELSNLDVSEGFFAADKVMTNLVDQLAAAGIRSGVDTVISGADFSDSLKSNLRFAGAAVLGAQLSQEIGDAFRENNIDRTAQLIAHAATGCLAGAVGGGDCGAGAAGQLAGEVASIIHGDITVDDVDDITDEWVARNIDTARLTGALASLVAGGDAADVNLGSTLGGTAAANNNILVFLAAAAAVSSVRASIECAKRPSCVAKAGKQIAKLTGKLGKKGVKNVDDLLKAGEKLDRNGLTKAGRAIQKHGDRAGSKFPQIKGSAKVKNEAGQKYLKEILESKNLKVESNLPKYGGKDYTDLNTGRGVRFDKNGNFVGFLN